MSGSSTQHDTPAKKSKQDLFLEAFAVHGNISQACRAAQIERKTVYRWKEKSDAFLVRYNFAFEEAKDNIRAEVYRRAHDGVEEPMVAQGQPVYDYDPVLDEQGEQRRDKQGKLMWQRGQMLMTRKYSDTLLIFHAKMLMPEYRDKQQIEHSGSLASGADVRALHEAIAEALADYPEARVAVAAALARKG